MIDVKNEEILQQYPIPYNTLPEGWAVVSLDEVAVDVSPGFASGKHTSDGMGTSGGTLLIS